MLRLVFISWKVEHIKFYFMKLAKLATIKSFNVPSPVGSTIICWNTSALSLQFSKDYQHHNHPNNLAAFFNKMKNLSVLDFFLLLSKFIIIKIGAIY